MARMTLEQLRQLRNETKSKLRQVEAGEVQVIVGMGTCGIAAGAQETLDTFVHSLTKQPHVTIKQTGCMGLCYKEPTVEIRMPKMPHIIYGRVDVQLAEKIIAHHIIEKKLVDGHILDRPAADICEGK